MAKTRTKNKSKYRGITGRRKRFMPFFNGRLQQSMYLNRYKNPPHYFKRTCNIANFTNFQIGGQLGKPGDVLLLTANTGIGGAMSYGSYSCYFTLDCLPNYTEFTNLFDRYKIVNARLTIIPFSTDSEAGAAVSASYAQTGVLWHGITDYDDATVPTATDVGIDTLRQFESYKTRRGIGGKIKQYCKPRIAVSAYGGGVFSRFMNQAPSWIDMNSSDTQHYGFKGIFEMSPHTATASQTLAMFLKAELTLYFVCKDLR